MTVNLNTVYRIILLRIIYVALDKVTSASHEKKKKRKTNTGIQKTQPDNVKYKILNGKNGMIKPSNILNIHKHFPTKRML